MKKKLSFTQFCAEYGYSLSFENKPEYDEYCFRNMITINNNLEVPFAFFLLQDLMVNVALDLVNHNIHICDKYGCIEKEILDIDFEVVQDYEKEETRFNFENFSLVYSGSEIFVL